MSFKKLEIYGFKSFADKFEVKFDDGITAIVGPNGCGKSNIADALRWVMGEQNPRLLRCTKMDEVIFSGTEKRKSLSYCEVSIHFDNSKRIFDIAYDNLVVSRKMYRDSTSEYLINNTPVRRKDIVNLLNDSGLGREGYAIIGQGKVDDILSSKPESRRAIFEEAAGISNIKIKKAESVRKLERTRDNLALINNTITEIERQLGTVSKQAEVARKYLQLSERLKELDVNIFIYKHDNAEDTKKKLNNLLSGVNQEIEQKSLDCDNALKRYEDSHRRIGELDDEIGSMQTRLTELSVEYEKQMAETRILDLTISNLQAQNQDLTLQLERYQEDYERSCSRVSYLKDSVADKGAKKAEILALVEQLTRKKDIIAAKIAHFEDENKLSNVKLLEAAEKLASIKADWSRLVAEKDALTTSSSDLEERIYNLSQKITKTKSEIGDCESLMARVLKQKQQKIEKSDTLTREHNEALASAQCTAREIDDLNKASHILEARLSMLKGSLNDFDGYSKSVKALMNDAARDAELSSLILGLVVQKLRVNEQRVENAIETALGQALQFVITDSDYNAKKLIAYLDEKKHGRVTFLPLNTMKPRPLERQFRALLGRKGCLGVADELITFEEKYANVFSNLLGSTVVVETIDDAIELARETRHSFRIVTLKGEVVAAGGSITGGSRLENSRLFLSQERELKNTEEALAQNRAQKAAKEKKHAEFASILQTVTGELHELSDLMHEDDLLNAAVKEKLYKFNAELVEFSTQHAALSAQARQVKERLGQIMPDIELVELSEQDVSSQKLSHSEVYQASGQEFGNLRSELENLVSQITQNTIEFTKIDSNIVALTGEQASVLEHIEDLNSSIERARNQISLNNQAISQKQQQKAEFEDVLERSNNPAVISLREEIAKLKEQKNQAQADCDEANEENKRLILLIGQLNENKSHYNFSLARVDEEIATKQAEIEEDYQLTYEQCQALRDENFDFASASTELNKVKKQIMSLGQVNVNAIEDCKAIGARFDEHTSQRDDILKAEADLVSLISELDSEALSRFNAQFEKIAENFKVVFKEMFNGGSAALNILPSEDPLEAGIEIIAEPPGKKLKSIAPLSGGEKALTAIAILFSILKLKPMPFCVLDEIEAALDDSNAQRFAKYLRKFSESTQFIVVTHRKPTMELSDNLYGVTMQEKGVSRIISVKLSDAIKGAE